MKVSSILSLVFVALVAGAAVPDDAAPEEIHLEETDSTLQTRTHYDHIKVCDSANYKGRCQTFNIKSAVCYNFVNHWPNTISSIHVGKGTSCTLYNRKNCKGKKINGIVHPGITDLSAFNFNDKANAIYCS